MNKSNNKALKILFVGAMETELRPLLKELNATPIKKLLNVFPLYKATHRLIEVYIIETFVGEANASVATLEAIKEVNPDVVQSYYYLAVGFRCLGAIDNSLLYLMRLIMYFPGSEFAENAKVAIKEIEASRNDTHRADGKLKS